MKKKWSDGTIVESLNACDEFARDYYRGLHGFFHVNGPSDCDYGQAMRFWERYDERMVGASDGWVVTDYRDRVTRRKYRVVASVICAEISPGHRHYQWRHLIIKL